MQFVARERSYRRQFALFRRMYSATALLSIASGILILLLQERIGLIFPILKDVRTALVIGVVLVMAGVAFYLMLYLRGEFSIGDSGHEGRDLDYFRAFTASLRQEVISLQQEISKVRADRPVGDREAILSELRSSITDELVSGLETKLGEQVSQKCRNENVQKIFQVTDLRLRQEISSLGRRGNVNLVIGVLTTGLAVGLLAYMVLSASTSFASVPPLLSHYIPRLSTVIFIEVFSFFFLRLYKSTLGEVKYYQNELTMLAALEIAYVAASSLKDEKCLPTIIDQIAKTKRNGVLDPSDGTKPAAEIKDLADLLERIGKVAIQATQKVAKPE